MCADSSPLECYESFLKGFQEGGFPQGKAPFLKEYFFNSSLAKEQLAQLSLIDDDFYEEISRDLLTAEASLENRLVSVQSIDVSAISLAGSIARTIRSVRLALGENSKASNRTPALDRDAVANFCTETIREINRESMEPLLAAALNAQLVAIRRMAELPPQYSDYQLRRQVKMLMADLLADWKRIERQHEELAEKLRKWCNRLLAGSVLMIGLVADSATIGGLLPPPDN